MSDDALTGRVLAEHELSTTERQQILADIALLRRAVHMKGGYLTPGLEALERLGQAALRLS